MNIRLFILIFLLIYPISHLRSNDQRIADSLLNSITDIKEDTVRIRKIIHLASNKCLDKPELAEILTNEALKQSININYKLGLADSYNLLGIINMDLGNFELSKEKFLKALEIYHLIDNYYGVVNTYNNIGLVHSSLGQYIDALDSYLKALKIIETSYKNDKLLSMVYINLGKLHLDIKNNKQAIKYLKKSEEICNTGNYTYTLTHVYSMLGLISKNNNKLDTALNYYTQAMQMAKKNNNRMMVASIHNHIGDTYFFNENLDSSLKHYQKSLSLSEKLNNKNNIIRSLNSLGYYYYYIKDYDKSEDLLRKCYRLSENTGFKEGIKNSSLNLSYLYNSIGEYKLAYEWRVYHDKIYDSIYSNKTFKSITEKFIDYEKEIEAYEAQIKEKTEKINRLLAYLIGVILLVIITALFVIQKNRTKRAIREQENLNQTLASKTIFLYRKNEVFSKVKDLIDENKEHFVQENQNIIQKILSQIQIAQNEEVWNEVELYFNKVHKNFYKNLNDDFPNLSLNDRRLCTLLKMNMTTKEISSITQQTPHSIDIARSRLRKKLGITNQRITLYSFLSKY
ncbi:MAG: tetratricopeptide repeat protein [Bacteroidales bacterium]